MSCIVGWPPAAAARSKAVSKALRSLDCAVMLSAKYFRPQLRDVLDVSLPAMMKPNTYIIYHRVSLMVHCITRRKCNLMPTCGVKQYKRTSSIITREKKSGFLASFSANLLSRNTM